MEIYNKTIQVLGGNNFITIKSTNPISNEAIYIIELAYNYIKIEYEKLAYIFNLENRILEAKYNAIEALQNDYVDLKHSNKFVDIISQYIINLEILENVKIG